MSDDRNDSEERPKEWLKAQAEKADREGTAARLQSVRQDHLERAA